MTAPSTRQASWPSVSSARPLHNDRRRRSPRSAFTLVELLVVVGIIAVLIALLMPVLSTARRAAQKVACASNLRQIGAAVYSYLHDNRQILPYGTLADDMGSVWAITWDDLILHDLGVPTGSLPDPALRFN